MIAADLGVIDYETALNWQQTLHERRVNSQIEDTILLLEHPPVITMGRSGTEQDLLVPADELADRNIAVKRLGRGGKITCHYPGQMVAYPIMDLGRSSLDIPGFVYNLEEAIIATLAGFGVTGERIKKLRGIFVKGNKIASVGVEIRQGVSMHGISLNVFEEKGLYDCFVPCGITDRGIEYLERVAPEEIKVSMDGVKRMFLTYFVSIFSRPGTELMSLHEFEERIMCRGQGAVSTVEGTARG